jgi:uncharacterized membrane protein
METIVAAPQPRQVEAGQGWIWIAEAFELFKRAPGPWIGTFLLWCLGYFVVSIVPMGGLLMSFFAEVLMAGWLLGCRSLETGGELKVEHLFAGFKHPQLTQLIVVGALYLLGLVVVILVVGLVVGGSMMPLWFGKTTTASDLHVGLSLLLGVLLFLAALVPLFMATWFAAALVLFDGQPAMEAMKQSFAACMANLVPFLLYGVVLMGLGLLAAIPLGLGFIVLGPVVIASVYTSYRDVFRRPAEAVVTR